MRFQTTRLKNLESKIFIESENIRQKELRQNFIFKKLSSEGKGKSEKDRRGLLKTLTALDESASHKDEQV